MLTALVLIVAGFFAGKAYPAFGRWVLIGGVILLFTSFARSFFGRGSAPEPEGVEVPARPEGARALPGRTNRQD